MQKILIIDYGSQFTQLIARRIRELNVYSEIHPFSYPFVDIQKQKSEIAGIILSGGPNSVYEEEAPKLDKRILELEIPILGVCYGLQVMAQALGGKVESSNLREYGRAKLKIKNHDQLFSSLQNSETVWMSHGDKVTKAPEGFQTLASTSNCKFAAISDPKKKLYGIQFHPEVSHTTEGQKMIQNFLFNIVKIKPNWTSDNFIDYQIKQIQAKVKNHKVLCGLSGGVDSSVVAALIQRSIGKQLHCVFVDHGLLRFGERQEVEKTFRENFDISLTVIDAQDLFFDKLKRVTDPEKKRKIIGNTFVEVFLGAIKKIEKNSSVEFLKIDKNDLLVDFKPKKFKYLAQGTLYPDVVESVSFKGGPSHTIKSHHNVGGLPEKMELDLVEPLRELFKDEVRKIGQELGLPSEIIDRHPFPGPGLGIRIIGEITPEKVQTLQQADNIFIQELKHWKDLHNQQKTLYQQSWQAFVVLTNTQSVGVMGDGRTYEHVLALRAVTAIDGMTADWTHLPYDFLAQVSNRIINEVKGINRVVYDISSKPPATIEWE